MSCLQFPITIESVFLVLFIVKITYHYRINDNIKYFLYNRFIWNLVHMFFLLYFCTNFFSIAFKLALTNQICFLILLSYVIQQVIDNLFLFTHKKFKQEEIKFNLGFPCFVINSKVVTFFFSYISIFILLALIITVEILMLSYKIINFNRAVCVYLTFLTGLVIFSSYLFYKYEFFLPDLLKKNQFKIKKQEIFKTHLKLILNICLFYFILILILIADQGCYDTKMKNYSMFLNQQFPFVFIFFFYINSLNQLNWFNYLIHNYEYGELSKIDAQPDSNQFVLFVKIVFNLLFPVIGEVQSLKEDFIYIQDSDGKHEQIKDDIKEELKEYLTEGLCDIKEKLNFDQTIATSSSSSSAYLNKATFESTEAAPLSEESSSSSSSSSDTQ